MLRYLFYSLESAVRWLRRVFRQLRSPRDQTRSIQIALKQLEVAQQKLTDDPASIGLVRLQLAQVARFIRREALLENDFDGTLAVLVDSNAHADRILRAIDQLKLSLQTELEFVKPGTSKTMNSSTDTDSNSAAADGSETSETSETSGTSKTGDGASPAKAGLSSSHSAALWEVTEKLYQSWQFKLLGIVMLCAVGFAVGGTFVLGGQTFRLHENIDKAEGDLKASKKLVEDLTVKNITELTAMRKDAESKIGDLKNEADKVKEDAVKRVVERLNTELAAKLEEVKSDNAKFINTQLALLAPTREKIAEDIDKIKKTLPLLGDAAKLEQTITAINAARDQANSARDLAAQSAKEAKETAQNEVVKMQSFSAPLNDRMAKLEKSIPDLAPLNDRVAKLEKSAPDLAPLNDRMGKVEKSVSDLAPLNGRMAKLEKSIADLTPLNDRVAKLEKSAPDLAPLNERMAKLEKSVPDLAPLNARVAKLEKSISDLATPKAPDLTPLNERIAKVEKSVADLAPAKAPDLAPLNERIAKVEKSVADLAPPKAPDLAPLNERIAKVEKSVSDLAPPKAPDLAPLNDRVTKVEKLVSDLPLDGRLAELERSVSDVYRLLDERLEELRKLGPDLAPLNDRIANLEKSVAYLLIPFEADLTTDQWEKIQIALTRRGFSPGPADGNSGTNTKKAIKQFQRELGAAATGHLTKPQIANLLDLQLPQDRPR